MIALIRPVLTVLALCSVLSALWIGGALLAPGDADGAVLIAGAAVPGGVFLSYLYLVVKSARKAVAR